MARLGVPFSCEKTNKVIKNIAFSIRNFTNNLYEKKIILKSPQMPINTRFLKVNFP